MTATEVAALAIAAILAGAMNAVAGGGTVLTFPALIFFGMPAIQANATSTFALLVGMVGSVYGYRRRIPAVRPILTRLTPVSLVGGLIGAILLTLTHEETFESAVPWLLLFATVLFLANPLFRRFVQRSPAGSAADLVQGNRLVFAAGFQLAVAVYGGYFGAGIGILMLASLAILGLADIHDCNAVKTVLGAMINLIAAVYFIGAGLVIWPQALVMTVASTLGYFAGAHYSQMIPQAAVRAIVIAIGLGISLYLFARQAGFAF